MRSSLEEVTLLEPGEICELDIEVNDIALDFDGPAELAAPQAITRCLRGSP